MVVDFVMPGMDGMQLITKVKSDHDLRHIPIVAITGGEVDGAKRALLEGFAIPALAKPWTKQDFFDRLEEAAIGKHALD